MTKQKQLYAAFLEEAAPIAGNQALEDVAASYRAVAGRWSALAAAAVPEWLPGARDAVKLTEQLERR